MNRQFRVCYHDGGRPSLLFNRLRSICQKRRVNAGAGAGRLVPDSWIVPADALQGLVLGYLSHILADMLTPAGVPLLWPCRWRFRLPILAPRKGNQLERALCMALFVYAVWMPQTLADNSAIRWSSGVINSLQITFNRFISHQSGR